MNKSYPAFGALLGTITSIPVMALLYLGEQLAGFPFMPFSAFDWLARILPGDLITIGIDSIVSLITLLGIGNTDQAAKAIEQILALLLFVALSAAIGATISWASVRYQRSGWIIGSGIGMLISLFFILVDASLSRSDTGLIGFVWIIILFVGWGYVLGKVTDLLETTKQESNDNIDKEERRKILLRIGGGSLGIVLGALGISRLQNTQNLSSREITVETEPLPTSTPSSVPATAPAPSPTHEATMTQAAREVVKPAPGTRPELTPTEEFYRIDINTRPPRIREEEWILEIDGLFSDPRDLTLSDLMQFPAITQPITLSCISNRIGGDLIGTSNWTGLRLRDLLADLGLQPEANSLFIEATDGFYESVDMFDMMDSRTLLVYGMSGNTLPQEHGFPLRIYRPDRYGMKQPKWITRITATKDERLGYWVERGWSQEARPQIVSVIDTVDKDDLGEQGLIPVGGIAWAGDRGIEKVELKIDDGPWVQAMLRTPPLSPLTWVQWRYDWDASPGQHEIQVRATDGRGQLQIEERSGVRPDGATGYHSLRVRV